MRWRRLPLGLIVPLGLLALVGLLATLQYQWLGQVSEAEREQLSQSLQHRASEFTADFDREITRAYSTFDIQTLDPAEPAELLVRLTEWQSEARFPEMLRAIHYAMDEGTTPEFLTLDPARGAFDRGDWPIHLEPIRQRLKPRIQFTPDSLGRATELLSLAGLPIMSDVPALVIPLHDLAPSADTFESMGARSRTTTGNVDVFFSVRMGDRFLILDLDPSTLSETVLPLLVERHFGQGDEDRYRVAVVDGAGGRVYERGVPPGDDLSDAVADVAEPLFSVRPELRRVGNRYMAWSSRSTEERLTTDVEALASSSTGRMSIIVGRGATHVESVVSRSGWRLLLQHSAGSLDAAVAQARQRNLWTSFGILSVLVASVGLIMLNARRSERLAAQQMDFVATVSHELRTPLAVIRSAAQNLSAGVIHDPDQARRYGDLIEGEGRRLTDMVEQVLEYAGLSGDRRPERTLPIDVGPVVREAISSCATLLSDEDFQTSVSIAPDLPPVAADPDAIRRAMQNLIANALKYGRDGRWLGITVSRAKMRGQAEVRIAVSDRGHGIEPDDLTHIFEPFYRGRYATERQIHGNGLGLSLVRRIAEVHGGRVTARSVLGEGATFTLNLPAVTLDPSVQPLTEAAAGSSSQS